MEEEKKENSICDIACACIHSALIAGDKDCMYGEDEYVNSWQDLEEDQDVICVLGTVEIDGSKFKNPEGRKLDGTYFRILTMIDGDEIEDFDKLFKEEQIWEITDGYYYYGGRGFDAFMESCCPIRLKRFEFDSNYNDYVVRRTDKHLKINLTVQRTCEACGKVYYFEDGIYTDDERELCCECYENEYSTCDVCDKETLIEDSIWSVEYGCICKECADDFVRCDKCGGLYHIDETYYIEDDEIDLCMSCFEDLGTWCDKCNKCLLKEDSVSMIAEGSDREHDYCEECVGKIKLEQMGLDRWKI